MAGRVRLNALQEDADRRERELMNLKMEVAHLRERLSMRVGGETNAIELEEENFTLKKSLTDTQETLVQHQQALRDMDAKYAKAMGNLLKLDQAWKTNVEELQALQQRYTRATTARNALESELEEKQHTYEAKLSEIKAVVARQDETIEKLQRQRKDKDEQLTQQITENQHLALRIKELEGQIEAMKSEKDGTQRATKTEYAEFEQKHQQAVEQAAVLRGEVNALRAASVSLEQQLIDARTAISTTTSRFLQLKEEHATLEVHLSASKRACEQKDAEISFFASEIDRIQAELTKRDTKLLEMEQEQQQLVQASAQHKKLLENAEQTFAEQAKKEEEIRKQQWEARETLLQQEVSAAQLETQNVREELDALKTLHEEVRQLFFTQEYIEPSETDDLTTVTSPSSSQRSLKNLVIEELEKVKIMAATLEKSQHKIAKLEKIQINQAKLVQENEDLKIEYEKTKKAMERIVMRRNKGSTTVVAPGAMPPTTCATRNSSTSWKAATSPPPQAKRRLDEQENISTNSTPQVETEGPKKAKTKRVFVASRYLNSISNHR